MNRLSTWLKAGGLGARNKAAAIWSTLSANDKAEIRAGRFPYPTPPAMIAAENEGYPCQPLVYHLRRLAKPEDFPPPSPVVWFCLGVLAVLFVLIILGYGGGIPYD